MEMNNSTILPKERLADNAAAVDMLEKMLALFHQERITAEQALNHKFFQWVLQG